MKAANPNVKICGAYGLSSDPFFIQNAPKYDCVVVHPYIIGPASTVPLADYHPRLMLAANDAQRTVTTVQAQMAQYQPGAEVIVTEYGHARGTGPSDFPAHFRLTLSEGLFTANALLRWASLDLPFAERHRLVDWVFTPLPTGAANSGVSDNSIIVGPAPFIAEPQAKVFGLFSRTMGTQRLNATIASNPVDTGSWGVLPNLEVLPTRWDDSSIGIIVINQSGANEVTATVNPQGMVHARSVGVLTVNGPSLTAYNTYGNPNAVDLVASTVDAGNVAFDYTFPAHSVIAFRLTNATAFDLITEQIALVRTKGGGGFAAQLQNAKDSLSKGAVTASCNQLHAYENHVMAQAGKEFDSAQASSLIQSADLIRSQIPCPQQ